METSLAVGDEVKKRLILSLIAIFVDGGGGKSSVKKLAGESLAQLSCVNENSATILGAEDGRIVDSLTQVVLDMNSEYRKSAADILRHLCSHYTTNEELCFRKLKNAMIDDVIPKVLREVLGCRPTAEPRPPFPPGYYYPYPSNFYPPQYTMPLHDDSYNVEEQEALSSLCATVHARLMSQDPGLANRFDQKAEEICQDMEMKEVMTFADLVRKAEKVLANKRQNSMLLHPYPPMFVVEEQPSGCCIS